MTTNMLQVVLTELDPNSADLNHQSLVVESQKSLFLDVHDTCIHYEREQTRFSYSKLIILDLFNKKSTEKN